MPAPLDTAPAADSVQADHAPDLDVVLDLPGLLADHLSAVGDDAVRQAIAAGQTIRRGQGHSVRITAPPTLHRAALQQSAALAQPAAGPAARKAHRAYTTRIEAACT